MSAAQRVVSCEYLLIPRISLVDGWAASGGRRSSSFSEGSSLLLDWSSSLSSSLL